MSTPLPQPMPTTEWDHTRSPRFRSTAATTGLVALVTLRELARRRGALALATLLPLTFFLVPWRRTGPRSGSCRSAWVGRRRRWHCSRRSRPVRWTAASWWAGLGPGRCCWAATSRLGLGWVIGLLYCGLVLATIGDELTRHGAVLEMLLLTATVATPLGALAAAVVPRDLEGALLLLSVMAVQVLVDPSEGWTRVLPLWSTRELASVVVENLGSDTADYLRRGLAHGAAMAVLLTAASWAVGIRRLRAVSIPSPTHG